MCTQGVEEKTRKVESDRKGEKEEEEEEEEDNEQDY